MSSAIHPAGLPAQEPRRPGGIMGVFVTGNGLISSLQPG
jgi:hypothetical protein